MRDHADETLRSKDPTRDGRHLHEPDGFPHAMIGLVFFMAIVVVILIGALYVTTGIGGALIGTGLFIFFGFPLMTRRLQRGAQRQRAIDEEEEHEVEAAEDAGLPRPKNSIEKVNERLNRSEYDESIPHTRSPYDQLPHHPNNPFRR